MALTRRQFVAGALSVAAGIRLPAAHKTHHKPNHGPTSPPPPPPPPPPATGGWLNAVPGFMQPGVLWVGGVV